MADKKVIALQVQVDTSEVDESVQRTTDSVEELGAQTKKTSGEMKSGFKAAEQGTKGLGSSIGGLIKALGVIGVALAVFDFMKDLLLKNQKVMDALNTATTALEILFVKLFEAVEPIGEAMTAAFSDPKQAVIDLWEAIKTNIVNRFEGLIIAVQAAGKTIEAAFNFDWDTAKEGALEFGSALIQVGTGLDAEQQAALVQNVKDFAIEVKDATVSAVAQADALVRLRNEVTLLEAEQRKLMLVYQNEAEIQRQIRDDISLTIAERLAANEELGRILNEQIEIEEGIANKRLELAQAELALNEGSIELQARVIDAETELADVRERINGQRSEQLTNQKALEKELFDFQEQLRVEKLEGREREIEELEQHFEQLNEVARLAGEKAFATEEEIEQSIDELREKFRKEDLDKAKKAAREKLREEEKIASARVQAAMSVGNLLGTIGDLMAKQGQENTAAAKTLAVAQILIDTAVSIAGAIRTATQASATPWDMIAGIAAGIAAVVAGISSATSILNSANVPGATASAPSASAVTAASAPAFNPVTTNTTELGGTEQAELAPIQAFVVETQITGNQENVNQIEGQASFGG